MVLLRTRPLGREVLSLKSATNFYMNLIYLYADQKLQWVWSIREFLSSAGTEEDLNLLFG